MSSRDTESKIEKLRRNGNWTRWLAHIKDQTLQLDNGFEIWEAYEWVATLADNDDPADEDYQDINGGTASQIKEKKLARKEHNKLWTYIRNSLEPEVFQSTARLVHNVPLLLRFLRTTCMLERRLNA